jgi:hypothetical protein
MRKKKYWIGAVVVCIVLIGAGGYQNLKKGEEKERETDAVC